MNPKRQSQVSELIKRNFSMVLHEAVPNICGRDVLISVTSVKISPDFSVAQIYLSVYGTENKQEPLLLLKEEKANLKAKLAQRIKMQVRVIPNIELFYDDTIDEMYRIDEMMNRLEADGQFGKPESDTAETED
jgi:ribosome-binding factor A